MAMKGNKGKSTSGAKKGRVLDGKEGKEY